MKKLLYLLLSVFASAMALLSCSQDHEEESELITDPPLGYVEIAGDISKDGDTFYFTVEKCLRIYSTITDRWLSADSEWDIAHGKKLRVAQPSENDSIISRILTECVGRSVKVTTLIEGIGNAIRYPERDYCAIRIKSIAQMDADARSMSTLCDD